MVALQNALGRADVSVTVAAGLLQEVLVKTMPRR